MAPPVTCVCGVCRKCKHREYMRSYYRRNPERIIQINKRSRERRIEDVRACDRARGFRVYDTMKVKARRAVNHALVTGKLVKDACESCGAVDRVHGHHDDHSKPLDVRWLCSACHGVEHRTIAT